MIDYGTATLLVLMGIMVFKDIKWHRRINEIKKSIHHHE